jgi:hypothetical protein
VSVERTRIPIGGINLINRSTQMNNSNNLMPFVKDGLELVIDLKTGASYAPGYRALARICSLGLEKSVRDEQVRRHVSSLVEGATVSPLLEAEIETPGGLQGATLIPENLMAKTIRKFNEALSEKIDEAGIRVFAHKLAGYEVKSTATAQNSSDTGILNEILKTVQSLDRRLSGVESKPTASPSHKELPQSILNIIDRRDKKQQAYANLLEIRDQWCKTKGIEEGALGDYSFCEAAKNGEVAEVLPLMSLVKFGSYTGLSRATLCRARKRMKDAEAYRDR